VLVAVFAAGCQRCAEPSDQPPVAAPAATIDWTRPVPVSPPNGISEHGYVGAQACRPCHDEIADRYARHPMARTGFKPLADLDGALLARAFDPKAATEVVHDASGYRYRPLRQGNGYFVEEYLLGADGERVHSRMQPITHALASGKSGMAFYFRVGERYHHVPIDYFPKRGHWGLDPGFARANLRFSSTLDVYCISCHTDPPRRSATAPDVFFEPLPGGVGCERCHGPGEKHVQTWAAGDIVDPARLSPLRQLEVCTQCHYDFASVLRAGRNAFSYRPGQPLDAFRTNYLPEPADPARITLLAHSERMVRSTCFTRSQGKLVCTTCHDPHAGAHDQPATSWNAACQGCHQEQGCTETPAARAARGDDCSGCHMRAGPAEDVPNVIVTDHWIQRRPPAIAPGRAERPRALVRWSTLLGEPVPAHNDDLAVEAVAHERAGLAEEAEQRAARAMAARPAIPEVYELLAGRALGRGRTDDATRQTAAVLRVDPDRRSALLSYAFAMLELGTPWSDGEATRAIDRLLALDPEYQPALETRGMVLLRKGKVAEARPYLARAVAAGPDGAFARVGLAALALRDRRFDEAITHLEAARRVEPGDAWIFDRLAELYTARGDQKRADELARARAGLTAIKRAPAPTPISQWLPTELR
jgi:Flp pilus assembly protein TadD